MNGQYGNMLRNMNGQTFNNGPIGSLSMRSPGDQQLAQREMVNEETSVQRRVDDFLGRMRANKG